MADELSLWVVGMQHPNPKNRGNRKFEAMTSAPGHPVSLEPEPKNEHDPHAVAVYSSRGVQMGYLTAEKAPWIGGMIRQGRIITAVFQEAFETKAAIRVAFDGKEPTLPPTRPRPAQSKHQDEDDGFYPDFIPPDEFD